MISERDSPLVSIGIPTFERVRTLERALTSALAQTHPRLEVVISDNASSDETEQFCRAAEARDSRIRYVRHTHNRGPTHNFNELFAACRGDYILMLADDDWLDPGYVAACLAALRTDPGTALVAGWPRYVRNGAWASDGVLHEHVEGDPAARVRSYLSMVDDNGVFYGLVPRRVVELAGPLPNVLGNDWLYVARIARQGRLRMLQDVRIHRELGGTSADIASILSTFGRGTWQARMPQLIIASHVLSDIAWRHPVYASLGGIRRIRLGIVASVASIRWRALAWHLVTPSIAALGRRQRGRRLWAAYDRLTRALGAGRLP